MIASLFNTLLEDGAQAVGTGTVGSSEATLAGLAFRHNWQNKQKVAGLPYDKPNMVTGANVQVCLFLLT
jgi:glutamate decarboxylase